MVVRTITLRLKMCLCAHVLVLLAYAVTGTLTSTLDGSPVSYILYPHWGPCLNASISFEFKTREAHAVLLYFNQGRYFFEVKLLKSSVRLRVNIGEGTVIVRAGESLSDDQWHKVDVRQHGRLTSLKVDGVENSKQSSGILQNFGSSSTSATFLVLGGLPTEYESKEFSSLALPSVAFEPRFRGSFKNFLYINCEGELVTPTPLATSGILTQDIDLCERGNPCLNGGRCLTTDDGLLCDCTQIENRGDRCEQQALPSEATFLGHEYLYYNLSNNGGIIISNQDQILLDFRTKQASSLLFYTAATFVTKKDNPSVQILRVGDGRNLWAEPAGIPLVSRNRSAVLKVRFEGNSKDCITVGLFNGGVFLSVNLGSGMFEAEIRPSNNRFDDGRWHHLVIKREAKEVTMELDGMYKEQGSTSGKFVRLSSSELFVAGSPQIDTLPGSRAKKSFKGCLRNVKYQADSIRLDLIDLAQKEQGLVRVAGGVTYDQCREFLESQPITFTTPESYLTLSTWNRTSSKGSLAFQFRTVEPGGVMMYTKGNRDNNDFLAFELFDGHLYLLLDMGSGVQKLQVSNDLVTDGSPHDIYFEYTENNGYISLDGQKKQFSSSVLTDRIDLQGHLYIGGLGPEIDNTLLPAELWAGKLALYYVGCLQDLMLNGQQVDLMAAAKLQNKTNVGDYCKNMEHQCSVFPCNHQGKCTEGWNRFVCDCRATGFLGNVCQTAAVTLRFDGIHFMKATMTTEIITQADDISLRFRTTHPNGVLFLTTGQKEDRMDLYLDGGILYLSLNMGGDGKILSAGHTLNDNIWHTVFIKRRMQTVELIVDQEKPVKAALSGQTKDMGILSIVAGLLVQPHQNTGDHRSGFFGSMQAFLFNGKDLFQMAKSDVGAHFEISAHFGSDEHYVQNPVTFKSVDAYAILPSLQFHDTFSVTFQLKTTENAGLILYNGGTGQDFFALELFQGFLFYIYDMGEGPQRVKANVNQPISDDKWHEILLLRAETHKQLLRVDNNTPTIDDLTNAKNNKLDLNGHLYVGGVNKKMYPSLPKHIYSRQGFVGCLGSMDLNGYLPDLIREANPIHGSVEHGCRGPVTKCVNESCANNGRCVQHWTSYKCDCDLTSFTGPACKDESVSYKFGPGSGLITFVYPEEKPSTNFDSLAFGFQTFKDDAALIRIDSKSLDDFIQLELASGHVRVTYNLGTTNHQLFNTYQKVNDGRYHVVRLTRTGPNATLQIDSNVPQVKNPTGYQSQIFNSQAVVSIGGRKANGSIIEHFEGIISGLVFNGVYLFELAKHSDPKIKFEGNVSLNVKSALNRLKNFYGDDRVDEMQSTEGETEQRAGVTDDIIFVGAGSGCQYDDEEDCSAISSGTDEIITAVVIIKTTTTVPTTTTIKQETKCTAPECETSKLHQQSDVSVSTSQSSAGGLADGGWPVKSGSGNIYRSQHKIPSDIDNNGSTEEPGKTAHNDQNKEDTGINLGLILGISISVLVAVVVLCIALCKLRSRDEGTYKVDETQNFSSLQSRKSVGNGMMASGSESGTCNRGKKKDVKEWYV